MVVALVVGLVLVALMLRIFVRRDGWADAEESTDSVEHAYLRRVAEAGISSLSPGAIQLAEMEREGHGDSRGASASVREFWRRFAAASGSLSTDAALEELRVLPGLLEEALGGAGPDANAVKGESRREDGR